MKKCIIAVLGLCGQIAFGEMVPSDMSMAMFNSGRVTEPTVFKVKIRDPRGLACVVQASAKVQVPFTVLKQGGCPVLSSGVFRCNMRGAAEMPCLSC